MRVREHQVLGLARSSTDPALMRKKVAGFFHKTHSQLSQQPRTAVIFSVARQGGKKGKREIMNWQSRFEKTVIALNLVGLALGFGTLGILILVKGEHGGESRISGVLGIFVGSLFLLFAFYFCKHTWGRRLGKVGLREAVDYLLPYRQAEVPRLLQTKTADLLAVSRQQSGLSSPNLRIRRYEKVSGSKSN